MKNNVVGWFEIPVSDMDRAIRFYETVFDFKIAEGFGFMAVVNDTEGNRIALHSSE